MIKLSDQKGVIIIITFLTLGILLLLGIYFLSFTITESKISESQKVATKTYYLAEAGINEAIWKLDNDTITTDGDDAWKSDFVDKDKNSYPNYWTDTFNGGEDLGGSYTVTIQNIALAQGEITSTATIDLPGGKTAQRVIKIGVFKAIGTPTEGIAVFAGGKGKHDEMKIKDTTINVYNGNIFSNRDVKIEKKSNVTATDDETTIDDPDTPDIIENLEGKILAVKKYKKSDDSTVTATEIHDARDYPPPPASIDMPMVDFDKGENSYKSQADVVYTEEVFEDMLWTALVQGEALTLNDAITYVKGSVRLKGGITLVINNGVLVAEKNIEIGKHKDWKKKGQEQKYTGDNQIIINNDNPDLEGGPATGLLAKRKIEFGEHTFSSTITGLLYAGKEIKFKKMKTPNTLTLTGGIMAKKVRFDDLEEINITLNDTVIRNVLENQIYSPLVSIEHWEESY